MSRLKLYIFLLYITFGGCAPPSRTDVNELRRRFLNINEDVWNVIKTETEADAPHIESKRILIEKHKKFTEELERIILHRHYSDGLNSIHENRLWKALETELRQIYNMYESFKSIVFEENVVPTPDEQRMEFSRTVLNPQGTNKLKSPIPNIMKKLSDYIKGRSLFLNIYLDIVFRPCELGQSTGQILYNLYTTVGLTQLKAFVMSQFAYAILTINDQDKRALAEKNQLEFNIYSKEAIESIKTALKKSNNAFWKCDPQQYIAGETYTELTQLLQGYLENEVDMNPRSNCLQNCAYYDYTNNMGCFQGICKNQRICRGKIVQCKYVDSDMTVCQADKNSDRRYEYIEYENERVFGRNTGCSRGTTKVDSWWRWLFWHCSYCICLCDDAHPKSDRYFSLRPVVSDISSNMVVTGIRFQKVDQVIHLQIREAKLLPFGKVNSTLSRWKPVESFKVTDKYVRAGEDFHMMSYENRDLDLDDLTVDPGYLVTGVKFREVGTHLNLEVQASPFNFTTGYLIQPNIKSFWHSSDETLNREKLKLDSPDVPTRTTSASRTDSNHNMYVEFRNTDLERDVGQTTVPFIDIQEVTSEMQVPLSGVGIYHKGQPNFGGFIGPKIMTYNFTNHILL